MKKLLLFIMMFFTSHVACGAVSKDQKELYISLIENSTTTEERNKVLSEAGVYLDAIIETQSEDRQETLLHRAVINKNHVLITWIFSQIAPQTKDRLMVMQNYVNDTAFHIILIMEQDKQAALTRIQLLFSQISDNAKKELILIQNQTGDSILHLACAQGFEEIATYILQQITDIGTIRKLLALENNQGQTAWDIANYRNDGTGSALMALLQSEKQSTNPFANFLMSNKPEHQQQRRRTGHGIALVSALVAGYDYYQYNKQKTKKKNAAAEKKETKSKKNQKQKREQKESIVTETKTGFKAYLKALYAKPMKHKKAFAGLIGALAAEYFALTQ